MLADCSHVRVDTGAARGGEDAATKSAPRDENDGFPPFVRGLSTQLLDAHCE